MADVQCYPSARASSHFPKFSSCLLAKAFMQHVHCVAHAVSLCFMIHQTLLLQNSEKASKNLCLACRIHIMLVIIAHNFHPFAWMCPVHHLAFCKARSFTFPAHSCCGTIKRITMFANPFSRTWKNVKLMCYFLENRDMCISNLSSTRFRWA